MKIEKKVWPIYFSKILSGDKNFEVRLGDFNCQPDDILILKEWDPETKKYTGREISKTVTSVYKTKDFTFWDQAEIDQYGYQIIGFK